ncbi:MAG: glycosyltransferase family 4 protein [Acidimicrobiales bacterium]|nr:glycosyltransferase family 4 protein [Acidimicrobiales bacterium]
MKHLLVTNDYPPKVGGIQNYLWELWRRLPPESTTVYCTPYANSAAFDRGEFYRIERSPEPVLIPYPWLPRRIDGLADEVGADLVLLDPAVPLGVIGPFLDHRYGVLLHGAEVTIPGRLPLTRQILRRVLEKAEVVVSAGEYALEEAERCVGRSLRSIVIPPGVDTARFHPLTEVQRQQARQRFDLDADALVVSTINRLVPRKGIDVLIRAAAKLQTSFPSLRVMIGGTGREFDRLEELIRELQAPVRLLGRLDDGDVPLLYGASDAMAMLCHDRWLGLEQEGFGIVFLEAAAAGIPQIAGRSGGAHEAVEHGVSGLIVDQPKSVEAVSTALAELLSDSDRRIRMGVAARARAVEQFDYSLLARRLDTGLQALQATPPPASSP